jgi:cell division septation protein DedD
VEFEEFAADSAAADSALTAMIAARYGDLSSIGRAAPEAYEPPPMAPSPTPMPTPRDPRVERREEPARGTFTVSFATLLDRARADSMADSIVVDGRHARVVPGDRDGIPVYRVLLGPFETRRQAERAGMTSRLSYWVFEGEP